MKEIIFLLPAKLQNWFVTGLIATLIGQFVMFLTWLIFGKPKPLLAVIETNFTSYYLGQLSADLLIWFFGGVLVYWWQIGRHKE